MSSDPRQADSDHRKRCRRYDEPGHAHLLTFSCFHRQPFLTKPRTRGWMLDALRQAREKHALDLWAYVIMPEHVHLLMRPRQAEYRISHILTTIKQSVSKRARLFVLEQSPSFANRMSDRRPDGSRVLRFWQRGGGYDRNLWEPRYVWEAIDYLHMNPVRRGLCEKPEAWVWSSASDYQTRQKGPVPIDFHSLPADPRGG